MASMQHNLTALILVGGFGTRLRPLTITVPKPLVPFANKPILAHQINALQKAGVSKVVLATSSRDPITSELEASINPGITIDFSYEDKVLGTAGPIRLARDKLKFPCFVLNADITCDYPFSEMLHFHKRKKKIATILATHVKDPSKYGVMVCDKDNLIESFVEKPKEFVSNRINAGVYIIEEELLDYILPGECSIEKEIFPKLALKNELCAFDLSSYWMDIGQPRDFIEGVRLFLQHSMIPFGDKIMIQDSMFYRARNDELNYYDDRKIKIEAKNAIDFYKINMKGTISVELSMIDKSALIGNGSFIGPNVVIGKNVVIGNYVRLKDCTIFDNVKIGDGCFISKSLIGWNSKIGNWVRIEEISVLGSNVYVDNFLMLKNVKVLPDKRILESEIHLD
ncbi:hypothetical protein GVAV_000321 [Gurleya vavrai]